MDTTDMIFYTHYYTVKKCILYQNNTEIHEIPHYHITKLLLSKDYANGFFPFFVVTAGVPGKIYRKIHAKPEAIELFIEIAIKKADPDQNYQDITSEETWIKQKFIAIIDDGTPNLIQNYTEEYEKEYEVDDENVEVSDLIPLEFALYNEEYLYKTREIVNAILKDVKSTDILGYILSEAKLKNMIISPSDNDIEHKQYIIPPITALRSMEHLANNYMFHKAGTVIFFDFNKGYFLNHKPQCTAWERNEYRKTYIVSYSENTLNGVLREGSYADPDSNSNYCTVIGNTIEYIEDSIINEQIYGNDLLIVNSYNMTTEKITTDATQIAEHDENKPTRYIYNNNPYLEGNENIKRETESASGRLICHLHGTDLRMFTPNKEYIFDVDRSAVEFDKLKGSYNLKSLNVVFSKRSDYFDCTVAISLSQ